MRFVVSKINFMDNDLKSEIKEYPDLDTAYASEMREDGFLWGDEYFTNIENCKQEYFNCDQMINIIAV